MAENSVIIKGVITEIKETQNVSEKFKKREFEVKETQGDYPNTYLIEFIQDKCDVLNAYNIGVEVEVHANLNGRKWTNKDGKVFNFLTLQAWKIGALNTLNQESFGDVPAAPIENEDTDGLPF